MQGIETSLYFEIIFKAIDKLGISKSTYILAFITVKYFKTQANYLVCLYEGWGLLATEGNCSPRFPQAHCGILYHFSLAVRQF